MLYAKRSCFGRQACILNAMSAASDKLPRLDVRPPCQQFMILERNYMWTSAGWLKMLPSSLVGHAAVKVSRYQLAALLPNNSSTAMINFIRLTGNAPELVIADQGRECISHEFEECTIMVCNVLDRMALQRGQVPP